MTKAIVKAWTATKDHGDNCLSILTVSFNNYSDETHINIDPEMGDFVTIWDRNQLQELIDALVAAGEQAWRVSD